jgi:hypothetical protein
MLPVGHGNLILRGLVQHLTNMVKKQLAQEEASVRLKPLSHGK